MVLAARGERARHRHHEDHQHGRAPESRDVAYGPREPVRAHGLRQLSGHAKGAHQALVDVLRAPERHVVGDGHEGPDAEHQSEQRQQQSRVGSPKVLERLGEREKTLPHLPRLPEGVRARTAPGPSRGERRTGESTKRASEPPGGTAVPCLEDCSQKSSRGSRPLAGVLQRRSGGRRGSRRRTFMRTHKTGRLSVHSFHARASRGVRPRRRGPSRGRDECGPAGASHRGEPPRRQPADARERSSEKEPSSASARTRFARTSRGSAARCAGTSRTRRQGRGATKAEVEKLRREIGDLRNDIDAAYDVPAVRGRDRRARRDRDPGAAGRAAFLEDRARRRPRRRDASPSP